MIKKYLQNIFKKISYRIFLIVHGRIKNSIKSSENIKIKTKNIVKDNKINYRIYSIDSGRLYTDRIHDTAAIIDNKIIEEASFQLRSGPKSIIINSKISDNIVFSKGTPRPLKKLNGRVLSLLAGGGGNSNYWHWLFDVLPKLNLCNEIINLEDVDFFLLPSIDRNFQKETLDLLNIPSNKRISSKVFRHIITKELIITDPPSVVTGNSTKDILNIPQWIVSWLRESFLKKEIKMVKKQKIYIERNKPALNDLAYRAIINEEEIKKYLAKKNFIFIKLENISFLEQVNLFKNAECIVGIHGAGLGNLIFSSFGTKIIELKSFGSGDAIKNLAQKSQLKYHSIDVKAKETYKFDFPTAQGSIHVPLDELVKLLEK